jgi:hypothetical protein
MNTINPHKLLSHPFNTKVYGNEVIDADFIKSVRENGVLEPVIVTSTKIDGVDGLYVLSGHRRTEAAKVCKIDVPYKIEQDQGTLWQENYLLEVNRQRVKTPEQMAREYTELKRIELALAEKRRRNGVREAVSASERAATRLGVGEAWARKAEVVVQEADKGNQTAVEGLARINSGKETVEKTWRDMQRRVKEDTTAYDEIARTLQQSVGMFAVNYSPAFNDPKHGFVFKARFICQEEAEAFVKMLAQLPEVARDEFMRVSRSLRK